MGKTVIFYRAADGKCPIQEFLDSLPGKVAQKVTWVLNLLEDMDILPSSYFKKLAGTDLWECRARYGSDSFRVLCFFAGDSVVVLTHGFNKKTQKTLRAEMERAEAYRKDFLRRRGAV